MALTQIRHNVKNLQIKTTERLASVVLRGRKFHTRSNLRWTSIDSMAGRFGRNKLHYSRCKILDVKLRQSLII